MSLKNDIPDLKSYQDGELYMQSVPSKVRVWPSMDSRLIKTLIYILLILVPILFVDYYVDSYASFRLTYKKIGKISVCSNYCEGTQIPLSERKAKWGKLLYSQPVDNIILGSSKSMQFSENNLGMESFYNLSVSGGCTVQDYMAEVYILQQTIGLPSNILIEVSPSLFNSNSGEARYLEWGNSNENMNKLIEGTVAGYEDETHLLGVQLADIVSPAYFKYNLQQLFDGKRSYIEVNSEYENDRYPTQHIDGSYSYSTEYQFKYDSTDILNSTKSICANHMIYYCDKFDYLDTDLIKQFEGLVHYLTQNEDINISFYLPPYSEYMYDYICNDDYYHSILDAEDYIIEFARSNNIQVYGSYDPENSHLLLSDQYDEYHIKPEKIKDTLWVRFDDLENVWNK